MRTRGWSSLQIKRQSQAQESGEQLRLWRHWLFVFDGLTNQTSEAPPPTAIIAEIRA